MLTPPRVEIHEGRVGLNLLYIGFVCVRFSTRKSTELLGPARQKREMERKRNVKAYQHDAVK